MLYGSETMSYLVALPLCMAAWQHNLHLHIWKTTLVWLNYHTYVKKKKETFLVEEPSHVKKLSPKPRV